MHSAIGKLMDYVGRNEAAQDYMALAMETFFGEISEDRGLQTINDLENFFGAEDFLQIYPVMLEFFFSNIYGEDDHWNVIDSFLKTSQGKKLSKNDRTYLKALRFSVMSVYEVTAIEVNKGLTVRDMVRGGKPTRIKEKSLTHCVSQWECLGLRVLDMGDHFEAAGACVLLERVISEELVPWLKMVRDMTMKALSLDEPSIPADKVSHYAEVMWASEIGSAWMECFIERQEEDTPTLLNNEDHLISPVIIRFPVTGKKGRHKKNL